MIIVRSVSTVRRLFLHTFRQASPKITEKCFMAIAVFSGVAFNFNVSYATNIYGKCLKIVEMLD